MSGPHGMRERVHPLTAEWLGQIVLDGYILYVADSGNYPFKVVGESEVDSGTLPKSAAVIKTQRSMTRTLVCHEFPGEPREVKIFAGWPTVSQKM